MRKLILQMQVSADGYFAATDSVDWQLWNWGPEWNWDAQLKADFNAIFGAVDGVLLSRKMAEDGYLDHWGRAAKNYPTDPYYAFAQRVIDVEKVVLTNKLKRSRWDRTTIAGGDFVHEVRRLKDRSGQNLIAFGGIGFASSLMDRNLVDELQLFINPTILGDGATIFTRSQRGVLTLLQSTAYACGMVVNRYQSRID
jgi:dihydrofolate reductase